MLAVIGLATTRKHGESLTVARDFWRLLAPSKLEAFIPTPLTPPRIPWISIQHPVDVRSLVDGESRDGKSGRLRWGLLWKRWQRRMG